MEELPRLVFVVMLSRIELEAAPLFERGAVGRCDGIFDSKFASLVLRRFNEAVRSRNNC